MNNPDHKQHDWRTWLPDAGRVGHKRKRRKFHPGHGREYVEKSVEDFLKNGGEITKLECEKTDTDYNPVNMTGIFYRSRNGIVCRKV